MWPATLVASYVGVAIAWFLIETIQGAHRVRLAHRSGALTFYTPTRDIWLIGAVVFVMYFTVRAAAWPIFGAWALAGLVIERRRRKSAPRIEVVVCDEHAPPVYVGEHDGVVYWCCPRCGSVVQPPAVH